MKTRFPLGTFLLIGVFCACNSTKNKEPAEPIPYYFGQQEPSLTPELFAPHMISLPDRYEFGCTLSEDGKAFYFGVDNEGKMEIHYTRWDKGVWTPPKNLFPGDSCSYNDPMLSPDENRLYFISDRPLQVPGTKKDIDLWYVEKEGSEWSEPRNLGLPVNSKLNEYFCSFTKDGTLYFASRSKEEEAPEYAFDIYYATLQEGSYTTPHKLPEAINTDQYEADVFIAPDETYMIFCSIREEGYGSGDLYVSFKNEQGSWTDAVNMGEPINTKGHELCPFVTKDGKYLFFTSNQDIYWVSSDVLDAYR